MPCDGEIVMGKAIAECKNMLRPTECGGDNLSIFSGRGARAYSSTVLRGGANLR
jgi:hypothetical protein